MKDTMRKLIIASLLAALICVATMIIKIPSPLKGYINLGDGFVLLSGFLLPPGFGFLAAGLGSALADLFSGYALYAPATFIIKGLMAVVAWGSGRLLSKKMKSLPAWLISALLAELIMILGYFLFEGALYGFGASLVNIPANGAQGFAGIVLSILLMKIAQKAKFDKIQ